VIDQHPPHDPGRDGKEMRAAMHGELGLIGQSQIGFVDKGRGLDLREN
jgi:hypothetical protein